jgi:hypothetical protein
MELQRARFDQVRFVCARQKLSQPESVPPESRKSDYRSLNNPGLFPMLSVRRATGNTLVMLRPSLGFPGFGN